LLEIFISSLLIGYSGAIMPGSMLTYTIDKSIKNGAKSGFLISTGHVLLELILIVLVMFGLGKYLSSEFAQTFIGIAGGVVLAFFGITMIRDVVKSKVSVNFNEGSEKGYGNMLVGGAVISASNPYFIFWWAVVGLGLIMNSYNSFGIIGVAAFYTGHIISDISWYGFISTLISKTRSFFNLKVYKAVIAFLGLCLLGFGISFLYAGLKHVVQMG